MILGIDTCTKWLNLALLSSAGEIMGAHREEAPTHTTILVPRLQEMVSAAGAKLDGLRAIGVVIGPGSFTGLRVGISAASGLGEALGVSVCGITSLRALAESCPVSGPGVAVLDARRQEVYFQRFERSLSGIAEIGGPLAARPDTVAAEDLAAAWAIGDGIDLLTGWPPGCQLHKDFPNLAVVAARAALAASDRNEAVLPLDAFYLRAADAKLPEGARPEGPSQHSNP